MITLRDRDELGIDHDGYVAYDVADCHGINTKVAVYLLSTLHCSAKGNRVFDTHGNTEGERVTSPYRKIIRGKIYAFVGNYRNIKQIAYRVRAEVAYTVRLRVGVSYDFSDASARAFVIMPRSIALHFTVDVRVIRRMVIASDDIIG